MKRMLRGHSHGGKDPPVPLPALRLLAPPMRLASAALWHTVQHRVVTHYGMLEEFVTMVTEIVPGLLQPKQRAQLILGLRAQLILELCRSEPVADPLTIKTHLDRMQTLTPLWGAEATDAEVGLSESNFLGLIETLQREPEERHHFFQNVFPVEFGTKYDAAIQTLMWQFLTRLEKLLQVPDFQEVASLLSEDPSALEKGVELLSLTPELRALLEHHSDPVLLDQDDAQSTLDGDCIRSALCLPPVERVVIVNEQTPTGTVSQTESTVKTENMEMETDPHVSENESNDIQPSTEQQQKEDEVSVERVEDMEQEYGEPVAGGRSEPVSETVMVVREDGTLMPLNVLVKRPQKDPESRVKAKRTGKKPTVTLERLDVSNMAMPPPSRSVRWNKSLKMKKFIEQERKTAEQEPQKSTDTKYSIAKSKKLTKTIYSESESKMKYSRSGYKMKHSRGPKSPLCCDKCGKRFSVRSSLSRHTKLGRCAADGESTRLNCSVCEYLSPDASQLEMHMMSHNKKQLFQCSNCERAFRTKYSWSAHQLVCLFASQQRGELVSGEGSVGPGVDHDNPQPSDATGPPNMAEPPSPGAPDQLCDHVLQPPSSAEEHGDLSTDCLSTQQQPGTAEPSAGQSNEGLCHSNIPAGEGLSLLNMPANEGLSHSNVPANEGLSHSNVPADEGLSHSNVPANEGLSHSNVPANEGLSHSNVLANEGTSQQAASTPDCQTCSVCSEKVVVRCLQDMKNHMRTHEDERIYRCQHCQQAFRRSQTLERHYKICKSDRPRPTRFRQHRQRCHVCGKHVVGLEVHLRRHSEQRLPTCPHCGEIRSCKTGMRFHMTQICMVKRVSEEEAMEILQMKKPPRCEECGKEFLYKATLKAHKLTHNPLCCAECKKVFPDAETLARHVLAHKPVKCTMCDKRFHVKAVLTKHYLDVHGFSGPFVCSHCPKRYSTVGGLVGHERTHTGEHPYHCSQCPRGFNMRSQLNAHETSHTGGKRFLCWECGKTYNTNLFLRKHMERHHSPNPKKPHQCSQCDQAFWKKSHLVKHMKVHHDGLKFPCSHCSKQLCNATSLARHMLIHGMKAFSCSYQDCGKAYSTDVVLRKHMERHHTPNPKKPHQCHACDQAFWIKSHLQKHLKVHHEGLKFPCSVCGKQLCSSGTLAKHMLIHAEVKAFSCSYQDCNKVFRSKIELTIHTRYHTGERPFKCRHCGKGFLQSIHATTHELTHTQERPHVCTVCDKAFNTRGSLNRHCRVHTGEKPYKCSDCGEAFKRGYHLKVHKQKHHPEN